MTTRDEHSTQTAVQGNSNIISSDTTTAGSVIDMASYESLEYVGTGSITDGTYTFLMMESDDNSTYTATPADNVLFDGRKASSTDALPTLTSADDGDFFRFGYAGKKRYVRLDIVSTATTSGGAFFTYGLKAHYRHQSTADQPAA